MNGTAQPSSSSTPKVKYDPVAKIPPDAEGLHANDLPQADTIEVEMQPLTILGGHDESHDDARKWKDRRHYVTVDAHTTQPGTWQRQVEDFLFPPHLPRSCQLLRPENLAVPLCYLLVGLLQGLSGPLINALPQDLGATEAQQTSISSIRGLPASFKLLFGFWSDNFPLAGYRRKPYMFMGWAVASLSMYALMSMSNLNVESSSEQCFGSDNENAEEGESRFPPDAPSMVFLSICILGFGTGFWLADVMGDSIVAEKAKLEPEESRGSVQSSCYSYRFFGMMMAAPLSTYLYSYWGPWYVIALLAGLPLAILPFVYMLHEDNEVTVKSTPDQCYEIWNTVCSRAVWQPMAFVYLFNALQVPNAAWREYLVSTLLFTKCQLNLILIVAYGLLYAGILCYKYFMMSWSWRKVYIATTLLNGVLSMLQVLLIYGITFGMSTFFFALGDDAFAEFVSGIQFLPTTIMMVHLCPAGSEGASYAMFTTVHNAALMLSQAMSTRFLKYWDVSKEALQAHELGGLVNLTYLTTFLQVGAIVFVGWLPEYRNDLAALGHGSLRSEVGGAIFLAVTLSSLVYAIFVGLMNIVDPGWNGES